jgi:hypothetical protein
MRLSTSHYNAQPKLRFGTQVDPKQTPAGQAMATVLDQHTALTKPGILATLQTLKAYLQASSSGNASLANLMADGLQQGVRLVPAPRLSIDSGGNFYQTIDTLGYKRPIPPDFTTVMPTIPSTPISH